MVFRVKSMINREAKLQGEEPEFNLICEHKRVFTKSLITVAKVMLHLAMGSTVCCLLTSVVLY